MHPMRRRRSPGFTLLELLVVLVIIGLLVGYVGPRYFAQIGKSKIKVTRLQIKEFGQALGDYRIDVGHYPTTAQGLAALDARPGGDRQWQGPYLRHPVPLDPWGHPYHYREPGRHGEYDLFSLGPKGRSGGTGRNAEIGNWQQ
ncbi:MAG: type II secretion system major pseudopilin GspG [Acidiferrobacteraceae bacterium]